VLAAAVAAAPGTARAGRLITFPSRSEVRLPYSAVVTWKGYVMHRLEESWEQMQRLLQRVVHRLAIQWEIAEQRVRELLGSERLAFLRPLVRRHGMFASVALLCCGILLLGLTTRNNEPVVATPLSAATRALTPAAVTPAAVSTAALGAAVAPQAEPVTAPSEGAANEPPPASDRDATGTTSLAALSSPPAPVAEVPSERRATGTNAGATEVERVAVRGVAAAAPSASPSSSTKAVSAHITAPSAAKASAGAAPADDKKPKPITKAMAQAAAKILTADELIASVPQAKKAAAAPAPRAATAAAPIPRAARPAPQAKASSTHPFDDRL
jgi:hypothetical protein